MRFLHALLLTTSAFAGCGDNQEPEPDPVPDTRLRLGMTATIPAGTEVEYCQFVRIPDRWVSHNTIEFTAGSHHVLVYQTPYDAIPSRKTDGTVVDTSGVFDCSDGATNGWRVTKLIGGSQNREGESIMSFPEGVGLHVGGIGLINVHYVNPRDTPLETSVDIYWDTMAPEDVAIEGDILFLYNPLIMVPPNGTSRAHQICPVYRDITIANLQSHMHARGMGYSARVDGNAPMYENPKWENVPVQSYDHLVVRAGSTLDYHCDYRNTEGRTVFQGPRSTDEMCMLIGSYYPADPRTANCLDATGQGPGGTWVGQGTATCAATLGCFQGARSLEDLTACQLASAPAVARPASDVLRCMFAADDPIAQCGAQIQACAAQ